MAYILSMFQINHFFVLYIILQKRNSRPLSRLADKFTAGLAQISV